MEKCWFGVSTGDGNNGVSHMWASYYVWCTSEEAWCLCEEQAKSDIKDEYHDTIEIDGDSEHVIQAVVFDDPCHYDDYDEDAGPASYLCDVFPERDEEWLEKRRADGVMFYDSLVAAFVGLP